MKELRPAPPPMVIALGHYLKTIFEYHETRLFAIEQMIQRFARSKGQVYITMHEPLVFFVKGSCTDSGKEQILIGLSEMNQRGVQNPGHFLRIYLPGVQL